VRECRVFRCDRGDYTRVLPTHCTRGCGCGGHPAFPTPSVFGAKESCTTRAHRAAGMRSYFPLVVARHRVDASRRSMTGSSGRSSIPKTPMMESRGRGILDTRHARGMTTSGGVHPAPCKARSIVDIFLRASEQMDDTGCRNGDERGPSPC
jgi:hypothetical protein